MSTDIDKTIERIENELQENEESVPRGAPTLRSLDALPLHEMPPYYPENWELESREVWLRLEANCQNCDWHSDPQIIRFVDSSMESLPTEEAEAHAREYAHDVEMSVTDPMSTYAYVLKGKPESERIPFRDKLKKDIPAIVVGVLLALSANLMLAYFFGMSTSWYLGGLYGVIGYNIARVGRLLWRKQKERLKDWTFCIGVPVAIWASIAAVLGKLSWRSLLFAVLGSVIGYNLYLLWKKLKTKNGAADG